MIVTTKREPDEQKAQDSPEKYLQSSIRIIDNQGRFGESRRRFSADEAISEFRSWTYAAIMLNANAFAALPLRLFVRGSKGSTKVVDTRRPKLPHFKYLTGQIPNAQPSRIVGQKLIEFGDDFEEVTTRHPILDLLHRVNPWFNGFDLLQLAAIYLETTGNAYWHPVMGPAGMPAEIWPMPSQWTWVVPDRDTYVAGYLYGRSSDVQQEFEPDEVIHFRTSNPSNEGLWYGMGKVEAAWSVIMLNTSTHEMDLGFAENRARPDYMVIVKTGATKDQLDRFEARVNSELRGNRKTGRFLSVTGDVEVTPLSFPTKDLSGREDIVEEIAAIFGTPVTLLKANDPNLASAQVGFASWRQNAILPLAKLIEQKLNEQLLPLFGIADDAVLAFDNPVPADRAVELQESQTLISVGSRLINEDRELRGDPPVEGGDVPRVNGTSLEKLDADPPALPSFSLSREVEEEKPPAAIASAPPPKPVAVAASIDDSTIEKIVERVAAKVATSERPASDQQMTSEPESQTEKWYKAWTQKQDEPQEDLPGGEIPDFQERMSHILRLQTEEILSALSSLKAIPREVSELLTRILGQDRWSDMVADAARPFVSRAIELGGAVGSQKLTDILPEAVGFDIQNIETQRFVDRWTVRLADQVNGYTEVQLGNLIGDGLEKGETITELAGRVRDWASDSDPSRGAPARAEMIARTESARAYVAGEQEAWKQSGVVERKEWLLAPNPCEFCKATAREFNKGGGIPLDANFFQRGDTVTGTDGGVMKLDYSSTPGPPLHPHCRCDLIPVLEERQAASYQPPDAKAMTSNHVCILSDDDAKYVSFETDFDTNPRTVMGVKSDGSIEPVRYDYDRGRWTAAYARKHCEASEGRFQEAVERPAKAMTNNHICVISDRDDDFVSFETDTNTNPHTVMGIRADGSVEPVRFNYQRGRWTAIEARLHCEAHGGKFEEAIDVHPSFSRAEEPDE